MRFSYVLALVLTLAGGMTFWYQTTAAVCPVPLGYRVGAIDSHFTITKEEAQSRLLEAEKVWEEYAGRELFYYDENAELVVDFIFDDRQASADLEAAQRQSLDSERQENEALFAKIDELQKEYTERTESYQKSVASYEASLKAYNEKVSRYNDQGGAPADVYDELEREKNGLASEASKLNDTANQLNELAQKINELSDQANKLVGTYNEKVQYYNTEFGYSKEFTQGDYQNNRINIYKFSNNDELRKVLVHEFGHALGIDHVEGDSSVMYYLLGDASESVTLSTEDKEAFVLMCGTGDEWQFKVRGIIRDALAIFNF